MVYWYYQSNHPKLDVQSFIQENCFKGPIVFHPFLQFDCDTASSQFWRLNCILCCLIFILVMTPVIDSHYLWIVTQTLIPLKYPQKLKWHTIAHRELGWIKMPVTTRGDWEPSLSEVLTTFECNHFSISYCGSIGTNATVVKQRG